MSPLYCPHCSMAVADDDRPFPTQRCRHCRLVIGANRASLVPSAEAGERAHASAAGVMRGQAIRDDGKVLDRHQVIADLRTVADAHGCPSVGRLRMLDYAEYVATRPDLPTVADVIATFGGWKVATREAPEHA